MVARSFTGRRTTSRLTSCLSRISAEDKICELALNTGILRRVVVAVTEDSHYRVFQDEQPQAFPSRKQGTYVCDPICRGWRSLSILHFLLTCSGKTRHRSRGQSG